MTHKLKERYLSRAARWLDSIAILCVLSALVAAWGFGWTGYSQTWGLTMLRVASGAAFGLFWSRYVLGLRLSDLPAEQRPEAAKSQAWIIAACILAVSLGR